MVLIEVRQDMAMANPDRQKDLAKSLQAGKFSIRDWREQLSNIMGMCVVRSGISAGIMLTVVAGARCRRSLR